MDARKGFRDSDFCKLSSSVLDGTNALPDVNEWLTHFIFFKMWLMSVSVLMALWVSWGKNEAWGQTICTVELLSRGQTHGTFCIDVHYLHATLNSWEYFRINKTYECCVLHFQVAAKLICMLYAYWSVCSWPINKDNCLGLPLPCAHHWTVTDIGSSSLAENV